LPYTTIFIYKNNKVYFTIEIDIKTLVI